MKTVATVTAGLLLAGCATAGAAGAQAPRLLSGDHQYFMPFGGRDRAFIVHRPAGLDTLHPAPVILAFHGGGGNGRLQQRFSGLDATADRAGFLVIYPDGTGRRSDRLLTWNAGTCCGYAADHQVDDVGFVRALIDRLAAMGRIDRRRVYATGMSNGAMMTHRLGAEACDVIAAIAPVAGGMVVPAFHGTRPVPVIEFHSVDDPRALYHGGLGPPFPFTNSRVMHPDIDSVLAAWVRHDGCPASPRKDEARLGAPGTSDSGQTATRLIYAPCRAGAEIVFWRLTGAGHVWPGGHGKTRASILGRPTSVVDSNTEIWNFLSRYHLPN